MGKIARNRKAPDPGKQGKAERIVCPVGIPITAIGDQSRDLSRSLYLYLSSGHWSEENENDYDKE
jgi:hypothetical protein